MSFWDSIDLLNLINTWLLIIAIMIGFVWGLFMIHWESKKVKSLKKRIIFAIIVAAIWGAVLLIVGSRINTLNDIEKEELRNELRETSEKIKHRIISNEQIEEFVNYLSHYPKGEIILDTRARSVEVQNYVKQLRNLLIKAGFDTKQTSSIMFGAEPIGIILVVKSKRTAPSFTAPLQKAFYLIGIDAPAQKNDRKPENTLTIIIGHKP